jgi:hypothetical protein
MISRVSLHRRAVDEVARAGGLDLGVAWADELERFAAMSVPERAAEVLSKVAPAIAESWEKTTWKGGVGPLHTTGSDLLWLLIPETGIRADRVTPEQHRTIRELRVTLAEAFHALVLARLLIPYDYGSGDTLTLYANSSDGLAALERGDVAEVMARRLSD